MCNFCSIIAHFSGAIIRFAEVVVAKKTLLRPRKKINTRATRSRASARALGDSRADRAVEKKMRLWGKHVLADMVCTGKERWQVIWHAIRKLRWHRSIRARIVKGAAGAHQWRRC